MSKIKREAWIFSIVSSSFGLRRDVIEDSLHQERNGQKLKEFFDGKGPAKIFIFYQASETGNQEELKDSSTLEKHLFITNGESEKILEKAVYFFRNVGDNDIITNDEPGDQQILWGEISPNVIHQINNMFACIYAPMLHNLDDREWGACDEEQHKEFINSTKRFEQDLDEAMKSLNSGLDICRLDHIEVSKQNDKISYYQMIFEQWLKQIEDQLKDDQEGKYNTPDAGPKTELEYWRARLQKITSLSEQLKTKDFQEVYQALSKQRPFDLAARTRGDEKISELMSHFNTLDIQITDKLNEAKDNVKYLATLEKFLEPLYNGKPEDIIETLPALMNAIKMIHTIARHYNSSDKMTNLFIKISNQMINTCKQRILDGKPSKELWKRDPADIIKVFESCISLYHAYREKYNETKEKVADFSKGKPFDFSESKIFSKFDKFTRRLHKLIEVFLTIEQFQTLQRHNLEGLDETIKIFEKHLSDLKSKPYDILDAANHFDRELTEFNVQISNLDSKLQTFIDLHFSKFRNIEYSLKLLKKFEKIIKRNSLKHNLTSKYNAILHNYAMELESIAKVFNDLKNMPPIIRNMPPDAGKMIWSRHLFRKIIGPMEKFPVNNLTKDIKQHYANYNALGISLNVYKMWHLQKWCEDIERAKAGLQAPLIIRQDNEEKIEVNFDPMIRTLIREAKVLERNEIKIPESAKIILLQEDKFKLYYNELDYVLKEYARIITKMKPITQALLRPHIEDLELKLRPGMITLTWTSMNIDSYLQHVHQGMHRLEQLIISVNDIIENRIENNLKAIATVVLVMLPEDRKSLSLEEFVDLQESHITKETNYLKSKNLEIDCAVEDLLQTILSYSLDPHVEKVSEEECKKIKRYYSWYLYQALLKSTQNSLNAMKYRICGRKLAGSQSNVVLKPLFDVDVQLQGTQVVLQPSLDYIQHAINKAATAVLRCSKNLHSWDMSDKEGEKKTSFYEIIAQDKEIVKFILLLTGSIQGTKNDVTRFLETFAKFEWLWQTNIQETLKNFTKKNPTLQDYEEALKKFIMIEEEIDKIESVHQSGALALKTENLKVGLREWAKEWKNVYCADLHKRAKTQLEALTEMTKQLHAKLGREVKDIDSLGHVMKALEEIRKEHAEIDMKFDPVLDMYVLLEKPQHNIQPDKDEGDHRVMLRRNWEALITESEKKQKALQTAQSHYLKKLKGDVKNFIVEVQDFRKGYETKGPMVPGIQPKEAIERLRRYDEEYNVKERLYLINKSGEDLFGLPNQQYPELEKTSAELKNLKKLYGLYSEVIETMTKWKERAWVDLNVDTLKEYLEQITKYGEMCLRLPKDLKEWTAYKELKVKIENFKEVLPFIMELKKPSIKPRHWQRIREVTGIHLNYEQEESFFLGEIIDANLLDHREDIEDICDSADKQLKIEKSLDEIKIFWADAAFEFSNGKRDYPCQLQGTRFQEIQEKLEEDNMTLATLNAMRHVTPFQKEVSELIATFAEVSDTLDMWIKVQILWSSLEAVFIGGDIATQMPLEAKKFAQIDKNWLKIMERAAETKKVIPSAQNDILKSFLPQLQEGLEACQKSLEQYLENKRKKFPRFYFVSNPVLLKILSQGSDPTAIQDDFEKLFDAISKVQFEKADKKTNEKMITKIFSVMGKDEEECPLEAPVRCQGKIEEWLNKLEAQMQATLRVRAREAYDRVMQKDLALRQFFISSLAQIALLGLQLIWTQRVIEGLDRPNKGEGKSLMDSKIKEIRGVLDILKQMCMEDLGSAIQRTKVETLVTIQVHQRDVTEQDLKKCKDVNEFEWQKQTRVYWRHEIDHCIISITDWDSQYNYEYLGSKERLCITKLTDRCYITLAQAMSMYYGGAPAGPAGTGKTETVKDLGRTLGLFVVVTNCSDQHRYRDMAKIFKGLCQSGLWGCFDEFNRIHLEVLSVVAMQIECINAARKQNLKMLNFPGEPEKITMIPSVGYFITMNPGYAGRQELPENLKVLFRSVSMMVPNRMTIIQVKLASVGYDNDLVLAKKFTILYQLCEEQLSKQRHYDFGLRNILSVLRTAGMTKRTEPGENEEKLLMRTLRSMNLSKLVREDVSLFESLLKDIFPTVGAVEEKNYAEVEKKIYEIIERKNLIARREWVKKIIQLYETSVVRHGFMLVGPTGTGKTTISNVLVDALTETKIQHRIVRLNPKAITSEEMYGVKNEISDEWTPGIFSTIWQKYNNRQSKFNAWIVCDGPVDAIWIENLNSVLDDNKILTLASGDRIPMTDNTKLVFEVENLNNASPATVSRCGIVYVSIPDLGYEPLIQSWVQSRKLINRGEEADKLKPIIDNMVLKERIFDLVDANMKAPVMDLATIIKVTNFLNLLNGVLAPFQASGKFCSEDDYKKLVAYALAWAVGGIYESKDRGEIVELLSAKGVPLPRGKEGETIYDFYPQVDPSFNVEWKPCIPEEWKPPEKFHFAQLLIPTPDSMRAELLITYIAKQQKQQQFPFNQSTLLTGTSGTAKTSSILMYSNKLAKDGVLFKRVNFSSATQPSTFQASIEVECDAKVGKNFAPPGNKNMTVFIDDMSMPFVNEWGDQITLEIVRQLVEAGGFYMLDKGQRGNFKNIVNLNYIGAMNHPGGGRNDIPNRLKRQFFTFNMLLPSNVDRIYGDILKRQFRAKDYSPDFTQVLEKLTNATVAIWNKVKDTLLPTPSKFHYVFNLRELSRVFKGIFQVQKEVIQGALAVGGMSQACFLIGVWRHECERVFVDKLTNDEDKNTVINYIHDITLEKFDKFEDEILEKIPKEKPLYFADFLRRDKISEDGVVEEEAPRIYEAVNDLNVLRKRVQELLVMFNQQFPARKMNLVLFDDALRHLLRITRIIRMQRSSGLLVGVGGSGKQSLTRLAASIEKNEIAQIVLTKGYGEKELRDELKFFFDRTGHYNKKLTFILTDAEVKSENFLEYINMVLATGEVPGIIAKDEREAWLGDIRNDYNKEKQLGNVDPPPSELYKYLIDRLRDNLHIILCMSPVGAKFRERARKFPSLFNDCTIDWFLPWPRDALVSVATTFIQEFTKLDTKAETKVELQNHMGEVHLMVSRVCDIYFQRMRRQVYVTPRSFLAFITSFRELYVVKYNELDVQEKSYKVGLKKIDEAAVLIQKMGEELKVEEKKLKETSDKTEELVRKLEKEQAKAQKKSEEVTAKSEKCQDDARKINLEKEDAEKELAAALPALKRAEDAVNKLTQKDIQELKALAGGKQPLEMIKYVVDAVLVLLQKPLGPVVVMDKTIKGAQVKIFNDSFDYEDNQKTVGGRVLLSDINLVNKLKELGSERERDTINDETIELLDPYFDQTDWFNDIYADKVSKAAGGLFRWVAAMAEYHEKSKIVKPKKIMLALQEGRLEVAMSELAKAQQELADVQKLLADLNESYKNQIAEKMALEERSKKTKRKIDQANRLILSLTDEKDRWAKGANEIAEQKRQLVGNVSMACSFISYCGPFNAEFRAKLINEYFIADLKKKNIPYSPKLELTTFLVDDATVSEWNLQGLPKDDLSIQNGIILTNASRYPLLIDPQSQGSSWLKNKFRETLDPAHSISTLSNPKFKDFYLRFCMEEGKTLIVEGIENEVDPLMDPVLEKRITVKGKTKYVDIAGSETMWGDDFKMFMTCKLANPSFTPELSAKTTIIDFTVTQKGLEQQLLGRVISKEQKALEDSLNQLLSDVTQNKKDLQRLDKSLLEKLTSSQGNLLEDTELVEVLNNTKTQAKDVQVKLADAEVKTKEINEKREQFRPVAVRGSVLYFCMIEITAISWMYNSSLGQFLALFDFGIDNAEKASLPAKRAENIIQCLTYQVYRYVNRGLFERDKATFLLMIAFKILITAGTISPSDVSLFLKGGAALDIKSERQKPQSIKELEEKDWLNVLALSRHHFVHEGNHAFFKDLPDSITRSEKEWVPWLRRADPEKWPSPDFNERIKNEKELGDFLQLCLVRCLKEDRSLVASTLFIKAQLGDRFVDPVSDSIESIYNESTISEPVLFLLSAGADPTSSIDDLAKKKKKTPVEKVSMGEGQDKIAYEAMQKAFVDGGWVVLQNCHLGLKFMEDLEDILGDKNANIHPEFRLWLTCEPSPKFPLSLLQRAIKVTNEPPKGLKAGLWKTYNSIINQDFIDKVDHPQWKSLIFTVCYMHSVLQERRKFGALGWCVPYEFNNSDLEASLAYIEKYLSNLTAGQTSVLQNVHIEYEILKFMVCEIQYGGRVTDDNDTELLKTFGSKYIKNEIFQPNAILDKMDGKEKVIFSKVLTTTQPEIQKYRDYISELDPIDSPEVFGLHGNADLTFRLKESTEMINAITETRPKDAFAGEGKTREEQVYEKVLEYIQTKVPPDYGLGELPAQIEKLFSGVKNTLKGFAGPLNIFLSQEIQRMQRIISIVRKTLVDIKLAIEGQIVMTPRVLDAINAIFDARVPSYWLYDAAGAEISWMLMNLGRWFSDLGKRNEQLSMWLKNGRPPVFNLGYFFNPQGFLTAVKQEVCRYNASVKQAPKGGDRKEESWSLDDVVQTTKFKDEKTDYMQGPAEGVYVIGLSLEGAKWNRNERFDELSDKKTIVPFPVVEYSCQPKNRADGDKGGSSVYQCPIYRYQKRTDKYLITRIKVSCDKPDADHWRLRGVAIITTLDN